MKKQEIYEYLKQHEIWHEITEHEAIFNMEESAALHLPYPEAEAKNLFLRDDKKQHYYLLTVKSEKRVDLKAFRQQQGTRPLTFVSAEELMTILGLIPGAVTPLGLLNDEERKVAFYLDCEFLQNPGFLGVHPNDNTATVWLKAEDLMKIIGNHGNIVQVVQL